MKISKDISNCKSCVYRTLLYDKLNDAEYEQVNNARKEYVFSRGEILMREGDSINSFIYLRKGLVKLFKTDHLGKDHILSINRPGDFINLLSIFSNSTYKYSISALEETHVCEVELPVLKNLVATNGEFAMRILNRMSHISDEIIENGFNINAEVPNDEYINVLDVEDMINVRLSSLSLGKSNGKWSFGFGGKIINHVVVPGIEKFVPKVIDISHIIIYGIA